MKKIIFAILLLGSIVAKADQGGESWTVGDKVFTSKAMAVRYIVATGKRTEVTHTRCEILTNKLTFKACPKNKLSNFENEQFNGLKVSK